MTYSELVQHLWGVPVRVFRFWSKCVFADPGDIRRSLSRIRYLMPTLVISSMSGVRAEGAQPSAADPVPYDVPLVRTITVDDSPADWEGNGFEVQTLFAHGKGGGGPVTKGPVSLRLAWNERGLLLLAMVSTERIEGVVGQGSPKETSCNLVLADARNLMNHYQVVVPLPRLAADAKDAVIPQASFVDRRLDAFFDPRLFQEAMNTLPPLAAEFSWKRGTNGYALEVLLPWRNLALNQVREGDLFHVQVMIFGGHGPMLAWHPHGWCEKAPWQMKRIRLARNPSPPVTAQSPATIWRSSPSPGVFRYEGFQLYLPPGRTRLRGVYVTLPGKSHKTLVDESEYGSYSPMVTLATQRAFVEHVGFALLGTTGPQTNPDAVLAALRHFAQETGRPELATVPLIVDGFSMGSIGTQALLNAVPERILAFTCMSFMDRSFRPADAALKVPGIIYTGDQDGYGSGSMAVFQAARAQGAPWALVIKPGTGHSTADISVMLYPFYMDLIQARLDGKSDKLREVNLTAGWTGHIKTRDITRFDETRRQAPEESWLSSRFVAELWKAGWNSGSRYSSAVIRESLERDISRGKDNP